MSFLSQSAHRLITVIAVLLGDDRHVVGVAPAPPLHRRDFDLVAARPADGDDAIQVADIHPPPRRDLIRPLWKSVV